MASENDSFMSGYYSFQLSNDKINNDKSFHICWTSHFDFHFFMHNWWENASIYLENVRFMSGFSHFLVSHTQISTNTNFKINRTNISNFHYLTSYTINEKWLQYTCFRSIFFLDPGKKLILYVLWTPAEKISLL